MTLAALKRLLRQIAVMGVTLLTAIAVAQAPAASACTLIVQTALRAADEACSGTTRNHVCYGNVLGVATPADGVEDLVFDAVGDIASLLKVKTLKLSPLDEEANEWGVALMQLQATLPDTLPGQNVTFLMFGDVTITENVGEQVRVDGAMRENANVRLGPYATGPILGSLTAGSPLIATGKAVTSIDELWIRVRFEGYRTRSGWILASLVDVDLDALPDVPIGSITYNPMQAFYFRSGIGQTQCASAPIDGVLVQTPFGTGKVSFNVNGIDIAMGSTALLTSPASEANTCVSLIAGDAELRSNGEVLNLDPGEKSCTVLNDDGSSDGPGPALPFDRDEIDSVAPVIDILPEDVDIPDPARRRTPTPYATVVAVPTSRVTATPLPTEFPGGPTNPPPTTPTSTPVSGSARFVNLSHVRNGFVVQWSTGAGPDGPGSYFFNLGDGNTFPGASPVHTYAPGSYSANVTACWSDGECIEAWSGVDVPPCAVDYTQPAPVNITYAGTPPDQYELFKTDEFCGLIAVGMVGPVSPNFSGVGHVGEQWIGSLFGGGPSYNLFSIGDTSPQNAAVPPP